MFQTLRAFRSPLFGVALLGFINLAISAVQGRDESERPKVGAKAADFELQSVAGDRVQLSQLIEDGLVVVVVLRGYPGYQCPVCTAQVGQFTSRAEKFAAAKSRVVLIYPGPADGLKRYADEFVRGKTLPENFTLLVDPDYIFTYAYGLRWAAPKETAYPATFVIDRMGTVKFAQISTSHGDRASAAEVLKVLEGQ